MRQAALLALAVTAVVLALPAGAVAAPADTAAPASSSTTIGVHLQSDGDARWTVTVAYPLNDSADRQAFERLSTEFESGQGGPSLAAFRSAADTAAQKTGRSMRITDPSRSHDVTNHSDGTGVGRLTLSFTWTNFANASGDQLTLGDVFAGGWFGNLYASQTLRVYPPEGYTPDSAEPETQLSNGALTWSGPQSFPTGGPTVVFVEGASTPWTLIGGLVVGALVVGVLIAYAWRGFGGRGSLDVRPTAPGTDSPPESEASAPTSSPEAEPETPPAEPETKTSAESEPPEELLSDEERVERLLEEHGGRMKQSNIVSETRWSDAKVSQLLSSMAEEGRVEKLRIGRENLITLPDEEEE
ncbi:helix-turn-helix transcriptional regulator [Halarchaeum sp. P4]|uniref:helix-turn-helix transcriptional regulator n=1 Tax=Halarchaeum sp. P4 TaxID=3421639 RepID=UPI003EC09FD4